MKLALEVKDVRYAYNVHGQKVPALNGIGFQVRAGEMVAIQGPSGSGKSTLLYLLGCMLRPDFGQIFVGGQEITRFDDAQTSYFRNRQIGFVFQHFHLLPSADVLTNILLPTLYPLEEGKTTAEDVDRAEQLARRLGLGERLYHRPQQLSGGQQQRVAIARALIRDAGLILADEPTGNLDSKTAKEILALLRELNREGKTVVIITHDDEVAAQCDRIVRVRDGRVSSGAFPEEERASSQQVTESRPPRIGTPSGVGLIPLLKQSLPQALSNMGRNRLRSFLTMLGVVVGVASIVSMLTLGTFIKQKILQSYATLGVNTMIFYAYPNWRLRAVDQPPARFSAIDIDRDVKPLRDIFPEIKRLSPLYKSHNHTAIYGGRTVENEVTVVGVNEDAFAITRQGLAIGSNIQPYHVENQSAVCVIGFQLAERLFQQQSPLGQAIQVAIDDKTFSCVVIGVARPVSTKDTRGGPNMQVVLPYTYFRSLPIYFWYRQLRQLLIEVDQGADVEETGKKIQAFFKMRFAESGDFNASNDSVLIAQMKRFLNLFTLLLVSIAALSLVVGGMGITNMMLVSVNERLREIGLRKALGASHRAIRQLFFAESLFLCLVSGLIGLAVGFVGYEALIYIGSQAIKDFQFEWVVNPTALMVALVAIVVTGLLSGLGPAIRAEKLQVIEALRSE